MLNAALFGDPGSIARVFGDGRIARIQAVTRLYPTVVGAHNIDAELERLGDLRVIFGTWGFPALSASRLDRMPRLQAVFYAAGSVQGFAAPLLERGITVTSAYRANGAVVAQFAVAQIVLAAKGYFRNTREYHARRGREPRPFVGAGLYESTIAVLGAGAVGSRVLELLKACAVRALVFDPFCSEERARSLEAEKVSLAEAFARASVVSNHLADNEKTRGMIGGDLIGSMPADGTLINTGRGATVKEEDLIDALKRRPDLTALLDVTFPEPPDHYSPLFDLPNVHLSSHIAGVIGRERVMLADSALRQFALWHGGEEPEDRVTPAMLTHMA